MYKNFGDKNFFEGGILVDSDHSDTIIDVLWCAPLWEEDENGNQLYLFADCQVNVEDEWIDLDAVGSYWGGWDCNESLAIGCINYYGTHEFSDSWGDNIFTAEEIVEKLRNYFIDYSDLVLTW